MSCCCENKIDLGCFSVCEDLQTGILATIDATYSLEIRFMSITIKKSVALLIGEEITIDKTFLNENSEFELMVKVSGAYLPNCYTFKTTPCIILS
jgi:hypothetical protein